MSPYLQVKRVFLQVGPVQVLKGVQISTRAGGRLGSGTKDAFDRHKRLRVVSWETDLASLLDGAAGDGARVAV